MGVEVAKTSTYRSAALESLIRDCVRGWDPDAEVRSAFRPDQKMDLTVISTRFEGIDSRDREGSFWQALDPVPKSEMVYLTYCLLLTPREAARNFGAEDGRQMARTTDWDE